MKRKTIALLLFPLLLGLILVAWGAISWLDDNERDSEVEKFREALSAAEKALTQEEYGDLAEITNQWSRMAADTKNSSLKWISFYNIGRVNLDLFIKTNDGSAYRVARANFRESLRKNPDFYDAKYNLAYLESLAVERGVNTEEIPLASDGRATPGANGSTPSNENGGVNEKTAGKIDLQNKIIGGASPGLGGEAPLDTQSEIDPEDIPQNPDRDY